MSAIVPQPQPVVPSFDQIGALVAYYFTASRRHIRRRVETIELQTERSARRHLTIDLALPSGGDGSVPWDGGTRLFYLPGAQIRKRPATTNMDLRSEDDRSLPVLTRIENAQITNAALWEATRRSIALGPRARDFLRAYLRGAVYATDWQYQAAYVASALGVVMRARPDLVAGQNPEFMRLYQLWHDVAACSIVWLGIEGWPGERRVVKFAYDVALELPGIQRSRRRAGWKQQRLRIGGVERDVWLYDVGDGNERGFARRMWNRFATTVGWAAYDISVDSLYFRNTGSYHLQFTPPDGVETREIRLRARLVNSQGQRREAVATCDRRNAHLFFAGLRVRRDGPAEISLRVGRRGFLSYATMSAVIIAGMLQSCAHWSRGVLKHEDVAVAILLLVPTLLAVFSLQPGEHQLATKLLAGVRMLLFLEGLMSAVAATVLLGALPLGFRSAAEAWHWYALAATVFAGVLVLSWLLALDSVERLRRATRRVARPYAVYLALALLAAAGMWVLLDRGPRSGGLAGSASHLVFALGVLGLGVLSAWLALFADPPEVPPRFVRHRRLIALLLALEALFALLVIVALGRWDPQHVAWSKVHRLGEVVTLCLLGAFLLIEPARRVNLPRTLQQDDDRLVLDERVRLDDAGRAFARRTLQPRFGFGRRGPR